MPLIYSRKNFPISRNEEKVNDESEKIEDARIKMKRMSLNEVKDMMTKKGESMDDAEDEYASDFLMVNSHKEPIVQENTWLELPLKKDIDLSSVTVYYSKDAQAWEAAEAQDIAKDSRVARVKLVAGKN